MVAASPNETDLLGDPIREDAMKPSAIDEAIERWFHERIHNSPVSQVTEIFNHVRGAVDDLKARIKGV